MPSRQQLRYRQQGLYQKQVWIPSTLLVDITNIAADLKLRTGKKVPENTILLEFIEDGVARWKREHLPPGA